jgi:hypothetical protein
MDEWAKQRHEAIATYRTLTHVQALAIGYILIDTYDICLRRERDEHLTKYLTTVPVVGLHYLAVFQPEAMRELYPDVIARDGLLWHGDLFCAGDAATRDALLARLPWNEIAPSVAEDITETSFLLTCLAWIGDDNVVAKFAAWRDVKLLWRPSAELIALNPSIADDSSVRPLTSVTYEAGWELTSDGARRNLYVERWRKMLPADGANACNAPVSVGS